MRTSSFAGKHARGHGENTRGRMTGCDPVARKQLTSGGSTAGGSTHRAKGVDPDVPQLAGRRPTSRGSVSAQETTSPNSSGGVP